MLKRSWVGCRPTTTLAELQDVILHSFTAMTVAQEIQVPAPYESLTGRLRGEPITLETRRFLVDSSVFVTFARLIDAQGRVASVTLSAIPRLDDAREVLALPILGLDFVALGKQLSLCVWDFSPTDPGFWQSQAAEILRRAAAEASPAGTDRGRPAFLGEAFSPDAVFLRGQLGREPWLYQQAVRLVMHYLAWLRLPADQRRTKDPHGVTTRIRAWRQIMLNNKKESNALQGLFGPVAESYLRDFLFAEPVAPRPVRTPSESMTRTDRLGSGGGAGRCGRASTR
jgi:hypothetical protein